MIGSGEERRKASARATPWQAKTPRLQILFSVPARLASPLKKCCAPRALRAQHLPLVGGGLCVRSTVDPPVSLRPLARQTRARRPCNSLFDKTNPPRARWAHAQNEATERASPASHGHGKGCRQHHCNCYRDEAARVPAQRVIGDLD